MLNNTKHMTDLIQDVTQSPSETELWHVFHSSIQSKNIHRWRYLSYNRVIEGKQADPYAGLQIISHGGEELTNIEDCVNSPAHLYKTMSRILRHIESPCYFEDVHQHVIISEGSLSEIRSKFYMKDSETLLIVPCFGTRLNTGFFLFVIPKDLSNEPLENFTLLSLECQLAHNRYRSFVSASQKSKAALSLRERKILEYVAEGYSNFEIGKALELSPHVVNVYVKVIFKKTNSHSRTAAVLNGIALGLIK